MLLNESEIILEETLLAKSKLLNMKSHLEALLRKKIRIETEIRVLRKQITQRNKSLELKVKSKLNLEQYSEERLIHPDDGFKLLLEEPELYIAFQQYDHTMKSIQEMIRDYEEVKL